MHKVLIFLLFFNLLSFFLMKPIFAENIKKPEFAGSFYPKSPQALKEQISNFNNKANISWNKGEILGVISPHAGYIYSGPVAVFGYKVLPQAKIDTVIILAASHQYYFSGISIYSSGEFETPLGNLKINEDIAKKFSDLSFVKYNQDYFSKEHSLEVQLPFILQSIGPVKIVPIMFSNLNYEELSRLAKKLADIYKENNNVLVVVSTDLSHYNPYDQAVSTDKKTLELIEKKDTKALWQSVKDDEGRACGIFPLITMLLYAHQIGADVEILKYLNSGDTAGDKSRVVGYVSAVIYKKNEPVEAKNKGDTMGNFVLNNQEKKLLLKIARDTLTSYLTDKKIPKFTIDSSRLKEELGAFVTLTKDGMLRGCIGRIVADTPLYQVISDFVLEAALHDPRFAPVQLSEVKDLEIEISVLTPFEEVKNLDEIEVGKDGLMIKKGWNSGLLLPQVATEYGWDKNTFLEQTCQKAGLPRFAYKDKDAIIYKFSALVFNEDQMAKE